MAQDPIVCSTLSTWDFPDQGLRLMAGVPTPIPREHLELVLRCEGMQLVEDPAPSPEPSNLAAPAASELEEA